MTDPSDPTAPDEPNSAANPADAAAPYSEMLAEAVRVLTAVAQDSNGAWIAEDPAAPPWTRQAWIASLREYGTTDEQIEFMARDIDTPGQAAQLDEVWAPVRVVRWTAQAVMICLEPDQDQDPEYLWLPVGDVRRTITVPAALTTTAGGGVDDSPGVTAAAQRAG